MLLAANCACILATIEFIEAVGGTLVELEEEELEPSPVGGGVGLVFPVGFDEEDGGCKALEELLALGVDPGVPIVAPILSRKADTEPVQCLC